MPDSLVRKSLTGSTTTMGTEEDGPQGPATANEALQPINSVVRLLSVLTSVAKDTRY